MMSIRAFEYSDMDAVLRIWLDASIRAHNFVPKEFWTSKLEDMREKYIPFAETEVFVDKGGDVRGFFCLSHDILAAIFVDPVFQGKGIGMQLMDKAKSMRRKLILNVYKSNTASVRFYEKCGFNIVKEDICEHTGHTELVMEYRKD